MSHAGNVSPEKPEVSRDVSVRKSSKKRRKSLSPSRRQSISWEYSTDIRQEYASILEQNENNQELSVMVSNENMENSMLFNYIAKMDPCTLVQGSQSPLKKSDQHQDLVEAEDIKQLQRDLISTNQLCQRLVTSQENQEPLLYLNVPTLTQVFGNSLPTVVRCRLDDMIPPVRIAIDYSLQGDMSAVDLAIFTSHASKLPDGSNCVSKYLNKPQSVVIVAKDSEGRRIPQYEHSFVYVAFYSEVGCSLELTLRGTSKQ